MNTDTMKDIIRDAHALAKSQLAEDLIRSGAEIIARRLERLVARGLNITPKKALDEILGNPPMNPPAEDAEDAEEKRGLVGVRHNDLSIVAWNLTENKNIRVTARKVSERAWHIDGYVADTLRISATVFGGKWATLRYAKFIRNGLMSRGMRRKHTAATSQIPPHQEVA